MFLLLQVNRVEVCNYVESFWWIVYLIHHEQHKQQMSIYDSCGSIGKYSLY
jgi:hypothetical protein